MSGAGTEWVAPDGLTAAAACRLAQLELARGDARFFTLEAGGGGAAGAAFRAELPGRHLAWTGGDASMVGAAGGLALGGKVPLVNLSFPHGLMRACEQVRLDLCYHRANAKLFGGVAGDAAATHGRAPGVVGGSAGAGALGGAGACGGAGAIGDIALARGLANLTVIVPADATAAYHATLAAGAHPGPVYLRLPWHAAPPPRVHGPGCRIAIGKGIVLRDGADLTLVAAGLTVVAEALAAAALLARDGIDARVIDLHTVKPVDRELLRRAAEETGLIVTVEEHPVRGGLGGAVAEALGDEAPVPMRILGIPDGPPGAPGGNGAHGENGARGAGLAHAAKAAGDDGPAATREELLRRRGLDAAGIAAAARRALAGQEG